MKILVAVTFEEGDDQHGSEDPWTVLLAFADGSTLELTHDAAQAHVDPAKFKARVVKGARAAKGPES